MDKKDELIISSLNVKGLVDKNKRQHYRKFNELYDINFVSETHGDKSDAKKWSRQLCQGKGWITTHKRNKSGAGLLCKESWTTYREKEITEVCRKTEGRIAAAILKINDVKRGFISVYAPCMAASRQAGNTYSNFLVSLELILDIISAETSYIVLGGHGSSVLQML